ncbi:MAG: ATP-binding protein [Pyrinomonadaceae bacterium]
MSEEAKSFERGGALGYWLGWLVLGRVAAAVLLLLANLAWVRAHASEDQSSILRGTFPIFVATLLLTLLYSLGLRFFREQRWQACAQIFLDVLLITWLVWITGDARSPFTVLYIISISLASLFLGPRGALITSVGCVFAFTFLSVAATLSLIPVHFVGIEASTPKAIQAIGLNDVAFLVVGLLAARLAERQTRSDYRLIAATQSLASLRALHERIVESIRSGVVTTDLEGHIYTFNAAAEEITGYRATDVRGQVASIFFSDRFAEYITASLEAASVHDTSPRYEADCLTSEGLRLRLGFTIFPLFAESGETTGLVITFQDLTQVRALEETSRRQDRLAAVGRVAASIAHEIRNPLAAMRGSIQVLRAEVDGNSSQAELMDIILRESDRLNRIITDYLTYARPRSNVPKQVDLRDLLHETFTLLRHSPEILDGHALEEELTDEPATVQADSAQLKQVFWNLARNALQAMPDGGTLRAELQHKSTGRLSILFTDTGRGMTPEQVEHLFEPFSSTTGGTGLGLSIVYQIIRDHGGTINVRSRVGEGTTITIELPKSDQ